MYVGYLWHQQSTLMWDRTWHSITFHFGFPSYDRFILFFNVNTEDERKSLQDKEMRQWFHWIKMKTSYELTYWVFTYGSLSFVSLHFSLPLWNISSQAGAAVRGAVGGWRAIFSTVAHLRSTSQLTWSDVNRSLTRHLTTSWSQQALLLKIF